MESACIGEGLGPFDVALLEIGQYHPSWGDIHLGPLGALAAFDTPLLTPKLGASIEPTTDPKTSPWWRTLPPQTTSCHPDG